MRSVAQAFSASRFIAGDLALQLGALLLRLLELVLEQRLLGLHASVAKRWRASASASSARSSASIFCARRRLVAQPVGLEFAIGQEAALLVEPGDQLLHAAAEDLGFGGLRDELAVELADAVAELSRPCRAPR